MPEALLERIIRVSSQPDDLVLDPFAGSGTTLAVAKRLGRRYLGMELSAAYAEAIEKRLAGVVPGEDKPLVMPQSRKRRAAQPAARRSSSS
jgi:site-specific DNA-methyltransferase (adenine-specific)